MTSVTARHRNLDSVSAGGGGGEVVAGAAVTSTAVNENVSEVSLSWEDVGRALGEEEAALRLGGAGGCRRECMIFERVSETLMVGVIVIVIAFVMNIATSVELAQVVEVVKVKVKTAWRAQLTAMFWFEILCTRPISGASSNLFAASAITCTRISHERKRMQAPRQTRKQMQLLNQMKKEEA